MQQEIVIKCADCGKEMPVIDTSYEGSKLVIEVSNVCDCPDSPIATLVIPQIISEGAMG